MLLRTVIQSVFFFSLLLLQGSCIVRIRLVLWTRRAIRADRRCGRQRLRRRARRIETFHLQQRKGFAVSIYIFLTSTPARTYRKFLFKRLLLLLFFLASIGIKFCPVRYRGLKRLF